MKGIRKDIPLEEFTVEIHDYMERGRCCVCGKFISIKHSEANQKHLCEDCKKEE